MDRAIFEDIRRQLRGYYILDIVHMSAIISHKIDKYGTLGKLQYPPFILLLLIKWSLIYSQTNRSPRSKMLTIDDFNWILNRINDLWGSHKPLERYEHGFLWLRSMAFQQFWTQFEPGVVLLPGLARQDLLFGNLPDDHYFSVQFQEKFGVGIKTFSELAFALAASFLTNKESYAVETSWFEPLSLYYGKSNLQTFLDRLSLGLGNAGRIINRKHDRTGQRLLEEFYEQSPLKDYPLLKHSTAYISYAPALMYYSLSSYLYDFLKAIDSQRFMDSFGSIFENYLRKCIEYTGIQFISEEELKSVYGNNVKVVDFILSDGKSNIFIDAKGVETNPDAMTIFSSRYVKHKMKDSILKGIKQGYSTAKLLAEDNRIATLETLPKNFLLIITYKPFYVGNGSDFKVLLPDTEIEKMITYANQDILPFTNIYFLSVDEFEWLIECSKDKKNMTDILEFAVEQDAQQSTKNFVFGQHLQKYCESDIVPNFLRTNFEDIIQRLSNIWNED